MVWGIVYHEMLRVVYGIVREQEIMKIVVISIKDDEMVYRLAAQRMKP